MLQPSVIDVDTVCYLFDVRSMNAIALGVIMNLVDWIASTI